MRTKATMVPVSCMTMNIGAELGAMPPVGSLYGLEVYLDSSLAGEPTIAFNAGTHREVVHMRTSEYCKLAQPTIVSLVREPLAHHAW